MTAMTPRLSIALGSLALLLVGVVGGVAIDRLTTRRAPLAPPSRQILYWYDPMVPGQHFDQPGRSPFMDMQLVPRYAGPAGNGSTSPGVVVDSGRIQTLGVRLATVRRGAIGSELTAFGVVDFNQRDVTIIQARATGFVQRVYGRAPGDTVRSGAPLADVLVPEWASAQSEYLAVRRTGDPRLIAAARQRLVLMGAPASLINQAERSGRARSVITIVVPAGGVIRTLSIRSGMAITQGQTLAEINGIESVWLNAAIPEAQAAQVRVGQDVSASFAGFPGRSFTGRVSALLPEAGWRGQLLRPCNSRTAIAGRNFRCGRNGASRRKPLFPHCPRRLTRRGGRSFPMARRNSTGNALTSPCQSSPIMTRWWKTR